jgi:hypothetical protein
MALTLEQVSTLAPDASGLAAGTWAAGRGIQTAR